MSNSVAKKPGPPQLDPLIWNRGVAILQETPGITAVKLAEQLGIGETKAREIIRNPYPKAIHSDPGDEDGRGQ